MGHKVEVYIYDLAQGMGRTLGPALIGMPIDGVWHTAVVVFGKEYFYGAAGIETISPGTTMLGRPLRVEDLGETSIDEVVFDEYLQAQSRDRFQGENYNLFHHNCNTFSHEAAQFLTGGRGIPQYILDLPTQVLSTPLGQMLAPMIQQMTPRGNSIPFTVGDPLERRSGQPPAPSVNGWTNGSSGAATANGTSGGKPGAPQLVVFDRGVNEEGLKRKLEEFNRKEKEAGGEGGEGAILSESELKVVHGIVSGLVRVSDDKNLATLLTILRWREEHRFPGLDILRLKCSKPSFETEAHAQKVFNIFLENLSKSSLVNARLSLSGLCNMLANKKYSRHVNCETVLSSIPDLLPTQDKKLEVSISSFLLNTVLVNKQADSLDHLVLILSTILSGLFEHFTQPESKVQILQSLSILLSTSHPELRDLSLSMDIVTSLKSMTKATEEENKLHEDILQSLKIKADGIDLD